MISPCYGRIYLVTNTVNGKVYVGQTTKTLAKRWKQHKEAAFRPHKKGYDAPLYRALRKYGIEAFAITELEQCLDLESLNRAEQQWVGRYRSTDSSVGYNATSGGGQGSVPTSETRAKITASLKQWVKNPSIRQRLSRAASKQWQDPVFRQERSEQTRQYFEEHPERRQQIAETNSRYMKAHPEAHAALNQYWRTPKARATQSEAKKKLARENPDALKSLQEGNAARLATSEGRDANLAILARARETRRKMRGDWVSEEVLRLFVQGLTVLEYQSRRTPNMPNPTRLPQIYGKTFGELRSGCKGRWS